MSANKSISVLSKAQQKEARKLIEKFDRASDGPSGDEEHEAAVALKGFIEGLLPD